MVSKRDFEMIASIIRESFYDDFWYDTKLRDYLVNQFCIYFRDENSRFNEEKFRDACEP